MFADVRCQYFYGAPADQLGSGEQTQSYEFEEEGGERVEEERAGGGEGGGGGEEVGEGGGGGEEVGGGGGREATEHPAAGSVEDSEVVRTRRKGGGRLESDSSAEQSEPTGNKETVKEEGTSIKQFTYHQVSICPKQDAYEHTHTHHTTHSAPPGQRG